MNFWKNKPLFTGIFAIGIFALMVLFILLNVFEVFQLKLADNLYRGDPHPSEDIVLVWIDENTINPATGLGNPSGWSRKYYATALENLNKYDPAVVVFDVLFLDARDIEGDFAFAEALKSTQDPVIAYSRNVIEGIEDLIPLDTFSDIENVNLGFVNIYSDVDDVVRKYPVSPDSLAGKALELFGGSTSVFPSNGMDGEFLINYAIGATDAEKYKHVQFIELYNDDFNFYKPENFKDKIVLIGAYDQSFNDSSNTPVTSERKIHNIEIHANAIQTMLEGDFLRYETTAEKLIVLLLLCALSAFVFMYTKIRWSVLYLVTIPAAYTFAAPVMFDNGIIVDVIHPYLALIATFISVYIYRYVTEFKEKNELKNAFSKYVSPEIVSEISKNPELLKLGGQKKEVSILFTDIAHFTSISEKLKPESLVALLNEYFDAMIEVVKSEGGTIDKYEGDAIMAFFGAPISSGDHALKACNTALKMRRALERLMDEWKRGNPLPGGENRPILDFRCGISTGEVIVGNIGASDRFNYTVIGDNVNLASRLESANKKYETNLMVSEATYEKVKDSFLARELDIIKVMGKDQPVKVYELLGKKDESDEEALALLDAYNKGMEMYHSRKFAEALEQFLRILESYHDYGPSKLYKQRCEVLKDLPPPEDWDGVFEMGSK